MSNEHKEKNTRTQVYKTKLFNLSRKKLTRYHANIFLRGFKFKPTPMHNNIELKCNIQDYMRRFRLAQLFLNKEANNSEENLFQKQSTSTPPRNWDKDLDHQIDVLNNLNLEEMETKSKYNFSIMELLIKPADKGEVVVILSTGNHQGMIMKQLLDESIYKKLDFCIDSKTK